MEQLRECIEVAQANLLAALYLLDDANEFIPENKELRHKVAAIRQTIEVADSRLETIRQAR